MSDDQNDCVVVGGGPSGLVLALLLARAGWQVTVVERGDGSGPPPVNVGPFVSPPNLRLFADLGLADELEALGQPMREVVERSADGSRFVLDYAAHIDSGPAHALSVPCGRCRACCGKSWRGRRRQLCCSTPRCSHWSTDRTG